MERTNAASETAFNRKSHMLLVGVDSYLKASRGDGDMAWLCQTVVVRHISLRRRIDDKCCRFRAMQRKQI